MLFRSCPLSLGQESLCESCDIKTEEEAPDLQTWQETLQPYMPHGIRILKIARAVRKSSEIATAEYELTLPENGRRRWTHTMQPPGCRWPKRPNGGSGSWT